MIHFEYMDKALFADDAEAIFLLLAAAMGEIAPTGNSYQDDYRSWRGAIDEELRDDNRKIVLIYAENALIGFFQYSIKGDVFWMEQIAIDQGYRGKDQIFRRLYQFLCADLRGIETVEAHAGKLNAKSQGILARLGLQVIGENRNGLSYHFRGGYDGFLDWLGTEGAGD